MNPTHNDECPEDPEILREVYKALKSCGWLIPETIDEVRRAEQELEDDPIELPEELLDPFQVLDSGRDAPRETEPPAALVQEIPNLPSGLARLALEEDLNTSQVLNLMSYQGQLLFNRSDGKSDEVLYDDWKRFYLGVKKYL